MFLPNVAVRKAFDSVCYYWWCYLEYWRLPSIVVSSYSWKNEQSKKPKILFSFSRHQKITFPLCYRLFKWTNSLILVQICPHCSFREILDKIYSFSDVCRVAMTTNCNENVPRHGAAGLGKCCSICLGSFANCKQRKYPKKLYWI